MGRNQPHAFFSAPNMVHYSIYGLKCSEEIAKRIESNRNCIKKEKCVMAASVFISYSSKNEKEVSEVIGALEKAAISYWKAPEMIPAGSNYAREIPQAIAGCQVFLLVLSAQSQQSIWVEKELDCAINHRKTIVPVQITGEPMSDMFRFYLNNVQLIDYAADPRGALERVTERLQMLLGAVQKAGEAEEAETLCQVPRAEGMQEKKLMTEEQKQKQRLNALNVNQVPVMCENCGGEFVQISRGTYRCKKCGAIDYDSFMKVRKYLERNGPRPISEITRMTSVPRSSVEYFLREELLEIPLSSRIVLTCAGCGAPIRTGVMCDACKRKEVKVPSRESEKSRYRFVRSDR